MEAFFDALTPDEISHLARTLGWAIVVVTVGLMLTRLGIHWAKKYSVSPPSLKTKIIVAVGGLALLSLAYIFPEVLAPPTLPAELEAGGDKALIGGFWGLTRHDIVSLIGISIFGLAAVVLILFGFRPFFRAATSVPMPASYNSPALNWVAGFTWLAGGFIGGAFFLYNQHQRFADQPLDPAILDPGTRGFILGLPHQQFLALLETFVLWLIAVLMLRFVVRRLWVTSLKVPGITISPVVQKAVAIIGWATGIIFSLLILWRIYQILTL